jgi:hypothetical protein
MLRSNYRVNRTTQFRALSDDQVEDIHLAVVLENGNPGSQREARCLQEGGQKLKETGSSLVLFGGGGWRASRVTLCNRRRNGP